MVHHVNCFYVRYYYSDTNIQAWIFTYERSVRLVRCSIDPSSLLSLFLLLYFTTIRSINKKTYVLTQINGKIKIRFKKTLIKTFFSNFVTFLQKIILILGCENTFEQPARRWPLAQTAVYWLNQLQSYPQLQTRISKLFYTQSFIYISVYTYIFIWIYIFPI